MKISDVNQAVKFTASEKTKLLKAYKRSKFPLFLLDYDGTLIESKGELIMQPPTSEIYSLLQKLSAKPYQDVYVISGRGNKIMEIWLGELRLNLVAEHGAYVRIVNQYWKADPLAESKWKEKAKVIINKFLKAYPGSELEEKDYTIAFHYTDVAAKDKKQCSTEITEAFQSAFNKNNIEILQGKNVVELRCRGIDKGKATDMILQHRSYDFIFAAGNDDTDEDMYGKLPEKISYSFNVGGKHSGADFLLASVEDIVSLLEEITA